MTQKAINIPKVKLALSIKEIAESIPMFGGGFVLLALGYLPWGIMCILAGALGILAELIAKRTPKTSKAASGVKLALEVTALIFGGITLIMLGQLGGGIACLYICATRVVSVLIVMPIVEKKYLTAADTEEK
jgi:hypothetical protein